MLFRFMPASDISDDGPGEHDRGGFTVSRNGDPITRQEKFCLHFAFPGTSVWSGSKFIQIAMDMSEKFAAASHLQFQFVEIQQRSQITVNHFQHNDVGPIFFDHLHVQ